jgi:hypothetical protein
LPAVVTGDEGENGSLSIDYGELVPVLVRAMQEQQEEIDKQAGQIAALESRLAALEAGQSGTPGQTGPPMALNPLSAVGIGWLVVGVAIVAGSRWKAGRS